MEDTFFPYKPCLYYKIEASILRKMFLVIPKLYCRKTSWRFSYRRTIWRRENKNKQTNTSKTALSVSQAEKAHHEFTRSPGSPSQESVHTATWREIKGSTASFSQLQGMDMITDVTELDKIMEENLGEIFLHPCCFLRGEVGNWGHDRGMDWDINFFLLAAVPF